MLSEIPICCRNPDQFPEQGTCQYPGHKSGNKACAYEKENLIRLGVGQNHTYAWSRTRKGGWAIALSPILITIITLKRLEKRGYEAFLTCYPGIDPHLNEPLYTRTVHYCDSNNGVRGFPHWLITGGAAYSTSGSFLSHLILQLFIIDYFPYCFQGN